METPDKTTTTAIIGGALVGGFAVVRTWMNGRRSLVRSLMDRVETLEKRVEHLEEERLDIHALLADEKIRHAATRAERDAFEAENRVLNVRLTTLESRLSLKPIANPATQSGQ